RSSRCCREESRSRESRSREVESRRSNSEGRYFRLVSRMLETVFSTSRLLDFSTFRRGGLQMSSSVIRFLGGISLALGACLAFGMTALPQTANEPWNAQGVINTSASPRAKLHSVPIRAVTMGGGFWSDRMQTNADKSIPTLLGLLEEHGVVDNFRRLSGRANAGRK